MFLCDFSILRAVADVGVVCWLDDVIHNLRDTCTRSTYTFHVVSDILLLQLILRISLVIIGCAELATPLAIVWSDDLSATLAILSLRS